MKKNIYITIMNMFQVPINMFQSNLIKTVLVPHGHVLTSFKHKLREKLSSRYLNKILLKLEIFLEVSKWQPQLITEKPPSLDNRRLIQNSVKHLRWSFLQI